MVKAFGNIIKAVGHTLLGAVFLAVVYEVLLLCGFFLDCLAIHFSIDLTVVIICLTALVIGAATQVIKSWVAQ